MRLALPFLALASVLAAACSNSSTTTTTITRPQLMAVDPQDFVSASAPCNDSALQSYVATLIDMTEPSDGGPPSKFALASSPPTPCDQLVTFSFVITSHRYVAQVDGYDRPSQTADDARVAAANAADAAANAQPSPGAIAPAGAGSPLQVDRNGLRVEKKWTTKCGAYLPSPDSGAPDAGRWQGDPPGEYAFATQTQTLHNCGDGLAEPSAAMNQ